MSLATEPLLDLAKNQKMLQALLDHEGHDIGTFSEDWTYDRAGRTHEQGPYGGEGPVLTGNESEGWRVE